MKSIQKEIPWDLLEVDTPIRDCKFYVLLKTKRKLKELHEFIFMTEKKPFIFNIIRQFFYKWNQILLDCNLCNCLNPKKKYKTMNQVKRELKLK